MFHRAPTVVKPVAGSFVLFRIVFCSADLRRELSGVNRLELFGADRADRRGREFEDGDGSDDGGASCPSRAAAAPLVLGLRGRDGHGAWPLPALLRPTLVRSARLRRRHRERSGYGMAASARRAAVQEAANGRFPFTIGGRGFPRIATLLITVAVVAMPASTAFAWS